MKIVRFVVKEDKKTGRTARKTDLAGIGEEEKKSLMRGILERGLKTVGFKPETGGSAGKK